MPTPSWRLNIQRPGFSSAAAAGTGAAGGSGSSARAGPPAIASSASAATERRIQIMNGGSEIEPAHEQEAVDPEGAGVSEEDREAEREHADVPAAVEHRLHADLDRDEPVVGGDASVADERGVSDREARHDVEPDLLHGELDVVLEPERDHDRGAVSTAEAELEGEQEVGVVVGVEGGPAEIEDQAAVDAARAGAGEEGSGTDLQVEHPGPDLVRAVLRAGGAGGEEDGCYGGCRAQSLEHV